MLKLEIKQIPTFPLNVVIPDTFNDDLHVVALFNVAFPDIFNDDMNVDALETNKLEKLVLLFKLVIDNIELVDNEFKLLNIVVDVLFKLFIDKIEFVDKLLKEVLYAYKFMLRGVDVIVIIVPWTELSELKLTDDILINIRYLL